MFYTIEDNTIISTDTVFILGKSSTKSEFINSWHVSMFPKSIYKYWNNIDVNINSTYTLYNSSDAEIQTIPTLGSNGIEFTFNGSMWESQILSLERDLRTYNSDLSDSSRGEARVVLISKNSNPNSDYIEIFCNK